MKKIPYLLSLVFLMSLTLFTACKDDEGGEETAEEQKRRQLTSGAFTVSTITRGGETVTPDGTIRIDFRDNGSYSISGGSLPSPHGTTMASSGSWAFTDVTNFGITLTADGSNPIPLTNVSIADNSLSFTYQGAGLKPADPAVPVVVTATR